MPEKILAVTRPYGKGKDTAEYIHSVGWRPLIVHSVQINPRNESIILADLKRVTSNDSFDWIVFMSHEGVRLVFEIVKDYGSLLDEIFGKSKIVAVGPKTRDALGALGFYNVTVPESYSSIGIARLLSENKLIGKRILLFRSSAADDSLKVKLESHGACVVSLFLYDSDVPSDLSTMNLFLEELQQGKIGAVLFTSSRSVSNLLSLGEKIIGSEMMHSLLTRCMIAAIGPVTADALKMQNVRLDFVSERSVINDAIKRLVETYDLKHEIQISA